MRALLLQYFNQILTAVLEVLDDSDSSVRELALSLIVELLKNKVFSCVLITSNSRFRISFPMSCSGS